MGDAISHAVLPGVVLAFLLGIPLAIGAFFSGIFCALGVGYLKENSRIKEDTAMGIVFSGMFAVGLVMFTKIETEQHLTHILLGSILGVSNEQLQQTAIIAAIVFSILMIKRKDLLLYCFDASHLNTSGLFLSSACIFSVESEISEIKKRHSKNVLTMPFLYFLFIFRPLTTVLLKYPLRQ